MLHLPIGITNTCEDIMEACPRSFRTKDHTNVAKPCDLSQYPGGLRQCEAVIAIQAGVFDVAKSGSLVMTSDAPFPRGRYIIVEAPIRHILVGLPPMRGED